MRFAKQTLQLCENWNKRPFFVVNVVIVKVVKLKKWGGFNPYNINIKYLNIIEHKYTPPKSL